MGSMINRRLRKRVLSTAVMLSFICSGVLLALYTFNDNIVFFITPTDLQENIQKYQDKKVRLGGLVKVNSLRRLNNGSIDFTITDLENETDVHYQGQVPLLFKEESGTIALGVIKGKTFIAEELLAKHDERYMPKEIAEQLKKSGQWKSDASL